MTSSKADTSAGTSAVISVDHGFTDKASPPTTTQAPRRGAHLESRMNRRQISKLLITGTVVFLVGAAGSAKAQNPISADRASLFIRRSGDRCVAILNGSGDWLEKSRQLQVFFAEAVDIQGIVRFSLGRFWSVATNKQRDDYVRLFPAIMAAYIRNLLGSSRTINFEIDRVTSRGDAVNVATAVLIAGVPPRYVSWAVSMVNDRPKIIDITAEGASLRVAQRDNCENFLAQNNHDISAFIMTLRQQVWSRGTVLFKNPTLSMGSDTQQCTGHR